MSCHIHESTHLSGAQKDRIVCLRECACLLLLQVPDCLLHAGLDHGEFSEESWTTDDEGEAAVNGNQMWSMSFEWQDGNAEDTSQAVARFEDTTDFAEESTELTSSPTNAAESVSSHTSNEAAEPSPADPDWVQPWEQTDAAMSSSPIQAKVNGTPSQQSSAKQKAKSQPMSEEHKTAVLGRGFSHALAMPVCAKCIVPALRCKPFILSLACTGLQGSRH